MQVYNVYRKDKWKYDNKPLSPFKLESKSLKINNNNRDIERPLKQNPTDLSFKGLLSKEISKVKKDDFIKFYTKYIGNVTPIEEKLKNVSQKSKGLISIDNDSIIHVKEKTIPQLAFDGILYPFKILPADMLHGIVGLMGKIPGLKNFSKNLLEKDMFKNIHARSTFDNRVNSLSGMINYEETFNKNANVQATIKSELRKAAIKKKLDLKKDEILQNYVKENKIDKLPDDTYEIRQKAYESYYQKHKVKLETEFDDKEIESLLTPAEQDAVKEGVKRKEIMVRSMKSFDPKTGNYDTKHERALNRLVSGLPPAVFLAVDAYNLSRMMDDDDKAAKKEQKARFKQEASRILSSGYLTLITMGAFQNFINSKKMGIALTTGITVLVTEMFSRLSNGKHITRLTPEEARAINAKNAKNSNDNDKQKLETKVIQTTKQTEIKDDSLTSASKVNEDSNVINKIKNNPQEKVENKEISSKGANVQPQQTQKPLLSFDTLMKASAVILGVGYGLKGLKSLPFIKKAAQNYFKKPEVINKLKITEGEITENNAVKNFQDKVIFAPFTNLYKKLTKNSKYEVETKDVEEVINNVENSGFTEIAKTMREAAQKYKVGDKINLGAKDKPIKPLVNFIIAPFKFIWNTITLPYRLTEKIVSAIKSKSKSPKALDIDKEVRTALMQSFDRIKKFEGKLKNCTAEEKKAKMEEFIKSSITKSFNSTSMSGVSNAELSNLAKTAASIATIWFLMTDNYNMVMLKSNGSDKEGAETKFKERFVQEGSRLFYQTLLIDLFNSTFRNQYNSSLWGMSWITTIDTIIGEILTRKSVGTPVKPHTRDELIAIEEEQNNSTGFKKKYYNFMQRLTGKRAIKTYDVQKKSEQEKEKTKV